VPVASLAKDDVLGWHDSWFARDMPIRSLACASLLAAPLDLAGRALDLTHLDPRVQRIVDAEAQPARAELHARSVVVAVAQPHTGRVVAFSEAHSEPIGETWARRIFAPGSILKPLVAAAALEAGAISGGESFDVGQPYELGGSVFRNYNPTLKKVSATDVIAQSVNVGTLRMVEAAGKEPVRRTLLQFGLEWTPSEGKGLTAADAEALLGMAVPATLASLIRAYSILANGGGSPESPPEPVISKKTADAIVAMMVAAVDHGTGKRAALPGIAVAGKTATVAMRPRAGDDAGHGLAIFGGFAPAEAPRLVAFVIIEGGMRKKKVSGGALAAPMFREVMSGSLAALDPAGR
jgi:cell division protein FtsI/penicillin-binding protein 2